MRPKAIFTVLALAVTSTRARAQELSCAEYVGQTIKPVSFASAVAPISKLPPKDEFETTADFEKRRASALTSLPSTLVIAKAPEDLKYFQYDAETRKLQIITYAFQNLPFRISWAVSSAGMDEKIDVSPLYNVEVVVSSLDKSTGTYQATNGYGAKTEVLKVHRTTAAIFDRKADDWEHAQLFEAADKPPYVVGELEMSPEEARRLKPGLKLALVVTPKAPYLITGTHEPYKVTMDNPMDITEDFAILIADIRCGLVTDAANKVLGAYPTRRN